MRTFLSDNISDIKPMYYLQINSCGTEDIHDYSYAVLRKKGRSDYHLLYVKQGVMQIEIDGKIVPLRENECALYVKGDKQFYTIPSKKDTVIYWMHFAGTSAEDILQSLFLTESCIIPVKSKAQFESLFYQIIHLHLLSGPSCPQELESWKRHAVSGSRHLGGICMQEQSSLLLQLLTSLFLSQQKSTASGYHEIYSIAEYIYDHFAENLDIAQLSGKLHISQSRFSHLFKELIGCSPFAYLQKLRLDKAEHYLRYTSLTVKEIAQAVGYEDALYFSRLFHKKYNISPREFRKNNGNIFEQMGS